MCQYVRTASRSSGATLFHQARDSRPTNNDRMWEIERYNWSILRASGNASGVPHAIRSLLAAASEDEADRWYWKIDNTVIVQGALYEAALPTIRCLIVGLPICSPYARERVLELLV